MPNNTYVELRKETVTVATPSVNFDLSGITGYTDLVMVYAPLGSTNTVTHSMRINGDTASNYSFTGIRGDGSSATTYQSSNQASLTMYPNDYDNTTIPGVFIVNFQNYTNTTTFKTILWRAGLSAGGQGVSAQVGLWRKTPEAITSITLTSSGNFAVGSIFSLYGIRAEGISPAPKATGGAIYSDANYYYHVFGATGVFTPSASLTADVLVVAGGAGGGAGYGTGGGGAGGVLAYTSQSLSATNYTCTIGGGGAGSTNAAVAGTNGVNSSFTGLTAATGGGGGASANSGGTTPGNGGSGGGATHQSSTVGTGIVGPPRQGYNGTSGGITGGGSYGGGGAGGGAGAIGTAGTQSGTSAGGGNGGNGTTTYSDWVLATGVGQVVNGTGYIAGGGAGGAFGLSVVRGLGGYGGGANGGFDTTVNTGSNGTANTGGGGGGASQGAGGGSGGSGVVIVRYLKA
jgi:hypothetical protein